MYVCIYVCVYVTKKINLCSVLPFKKFLLSILYHLILEFKRLFYVQRVVQMEQFVCVLFKTDSGILHYGMPLLTLCNCNIMSSSARSSSKQHVHSSACSAVIDSACSAVQLSLHMQQSADSAFCTHKVCVP